MDTIGSCVCWSAAASGFLMSDARELGVVLEHEVVLDRVAAGSGLPLGLDHHDALRHLQHLAALGGPVLRAELPVALARPLAFAVPSGTVGELGLAVAALGYVVAARFGPLTPSKSASSSLQVASGPAISRLFGPKR